MAIKKIPCGGFRYDDETVEFVDGVMKAKGASKEVTNAIETGGLGWTESEPKEGFDITWDGNTEGAISFNSFYYQKVADYFISDDIVGSEYYTNLNGETEEHIIQGSDEEVDCFMETDFGWSVEQAIIAVSDTYELDGVTFSSGVYFVSIPSMGLYVSRLYKEATTEEVVHQIDQKYIPSGGSGGTTFVHFEWDGEGTAVTADKTPTEALNLMTSGALITGMLTVGELTLPIGYALMDLDHGFPAFAIIYIDSETTLPVYAINSNDSGEWVCNLEIL